MSKYVINPNAACGVPLIHLAECNLFQYGTNNLENVPSLIVNILKGEPIQQVPWRVRGIGLCETCIGVPGNWKDERKKVSV